MPKDTFFNLPDEKRQFITDCAVDEFAEHGFERASVNRIVAAAGIAKGSFYQYFCDKYDVYQYILDSMVAGRKLGITREMTPKIQEMNLFDFLRAIFRQMICEFLERPKLIRVALDFWYMPLNFQKIYYSRYGAEIHNYFRPFVEARQRAGEIAADIDAEMLGDMLLSQSMSFAQYFMREDVNISEDMADNLVNNMERILSRGIFSEKRE